MQKYGKVYVLKKNVMEHQTNYVWRNSGKEKRSDWKEKEVQLIPMEEHGYI